jgi:hypothetical protein
MRSVLILPLFIAALSVSAVLTAADFKMNNGNVLTGDLASADEDGIVVKLQVGTLTKREPWVNFTQETLKELARDPKIQPLVDPFIEVTLEELDAKQKKKDIVIRDVPTRLDRPDHRPGFFTAFLSPIGLLLLTVFMGANLYAAYEIALYRDRPVPMVCAVSLVLPFLGPLLFLSIPSGTPPPPEESAPEPSAAAAAPASSFASNPNMPKSSLSIAATDKAGAAAAASQPQVFGRGEFTFNRRFIETKFSGFFRLVPTEAEKDLVLVVKGVKQEYIGKRITRISSNEFHMQLLANNTEVMITFAEIQTITVRHKDHRA